MLNHHKSHLLAVFATALQHIEEIRQVAALGKSPSGLPLTPLPQEQRRELLAVLDRLSGQLQDLVRTVAPDQEQDGRPAPLSATHMWLSILLRGLQESLADLDPVRISSRYGALDSHTFAALGPAVTQILEDVASAISTFSQ